jgi:hypothetical protein
LEGVVVGSEFAVVENSPNTREVRLMARAETLHSRDDRDQEGGYGGDALKRE